MEREQSEDTQEGISRLDRSYFGQLFTEFKPLTLLSAIKIARQAFEEKSTVGKMFDSFEEAGIMDRNGEPATQQQLSILQHGYAADRTDWDQILNSMNQGEQDRG